MSELPIRKSENCKHNVRINMYFFRKNFEEILSGLLMDFLGPQLTDYLSTMLQFPFRRPEKRKVRFVYFVIEKLKILQIPLICHGFG